MTTWNPSDKAADVTLTFGNTVASVSSGSGMVRSTTSKSSGKYYFEVNVTNSATLVDIGIADSSALLSNGVGASGDNAIGYLSAGFIFRDGIIAGSGGAFSNGSVVGVAVDVNNFAYFAINNVWQHSANPATGTGGTGILVPNPMFAAASLNDADSVTANFGPSFTYTPPTGFTAWDLTATNVSLTGVSATGSAGTITADSPNRTTLLSGVSATGNAGTIAPSHSSNISITGVSATGGAGTIQVGSVSGPLATTEARDTVSMAANVANSGGLGATEARDTVSMRGHYGFIGWIPAEIQVETWTEE